MNDYKWKVGERFCSNDRLGTVLNLFEGTVKEGFWVKVLYDKMEFDGDFWEADELIQNIFPIKIIFKEKIIIRI
jgi:hypothetical protein